jgi:secretion/DNA translocation related TadE-like protein
VTTTPQPAPVTAPPKARVETAAPEPGAGAAPEPGVGSAAPEPGVGEGVRGLPACVGPRRGRGSPDGGSASVWVAAAGLVLVAAGVAGSAVGLAVVGRHQARTAADLGALAGALAVVDGDGEACRRAAVIASANGARMLSCTVDGWEVVITVDVDVHPLPGLSRTAVASARAGPVAWA